MASPNSEDQERIQRRFGECLQWADKIVHSAYALLRTELKVPISFRYTHSAPTDILTSEQRAQVLLFLDKLAGLPDLSTIKVKPDGKQHRIDNLTDFRSALNDFRPVLINRSDSIHFTRMHSLCSRALNNRDPTKGMSITVLFQTGGDATTLFCKFLKEHKAAVARIVDLADFDYIYNGILQHSDPKHGARYTADHYSGDLNYVIVRNALLLPTITELLEPHARLFGPFNPPHPGSL